MKRFFIIICLIISTTAFAKLRVVASYPYIADIVKKIGRDKVHVKTLGRGNWDPHHVVPKPSLISIARRADIIIINGADLEVGWLPQIIRESHNRKIRQGAGGYLDLSKILSLIDIPKELSRAYGDVHPQGNPHFNLDPYNIPLIARAIYIRLSRKDPSNSSFYKDNFKKFNKLWGDKTREWNGALSALKGLKVVQYHKQFDYFFKRYGIICVTEIEPLPGIPPTSGHTKKVISLIKSENVKLIINDVFHSSKPAKFISGRAGIKLIILPHDIGAVKEAGDIVALFDEIVRRLTK